MATMRSCRRAILILWVLVAGVACREAEPMTTDLNADDELELSSIVIRADFSDDAAWQKVWEAINTPVGTFEANLIAIEDRKYDGLTAERLPAILPKNFRHTFVFIVDRTALVEREHPVLVVDAYEEPGRFFRVIPSEVWGVQNNLKLANMDWEDFSESTDPDGVFRGFPR
jgi:hypothetical protein